METLFENKGKRVKKTLPEYLLGNGYAEDLHWWSAFLCRRPVLHLIEITAETVTFSYWRKKGCFVFSDGYFSALAVNI